MKEFSKDIDIVCIFYIIFIQEIFTKNYSKTIHLYCFSQYQKCLVKLFELCDHPQVIRIHNLLRFML